MQHMTWRKGYTAMKPSKSEIRKIEKIYGRLVFVHGPHDALQKLYNYFVLEWADVIISIWRERFKLEKENQDCEQWLIKEIPDSPQEKIYNAWLKANFFNVCKKTEIPVRSILSDAGSEAFIPMKLTI